jgi:hypothetical protein
MFSATGDVIMIVFGLVLGIVTLHFPALLALARGAHFGFRRFSSFLDAGR